MVVVFLRVACRLGTKFDGIDPTRGVAGLLHEAFCRTAFNTDVKDAVPGCSSNNIIGLQTKVVRDRHALIMISPRLVGPIVLPVYIRISN